jgi:hypothetical protein
MICPLMMCNSLSGKKNTMMMRYHSSNEKERRFWGAKGELFLLNN